MNAIEQKTAAKKFAEYWKDKGDEKQETARFWIELLGNVLGVADPTKFIEFEKPVIVEKIRNISTVTFRQPKSSLNKRALMSSLVVQPCSLTEKN